jgi:hypothetical protein
MKTESQKATQTEPMTPLEVAQERGKRFYAELKRADDAMAAQLLGAWKEDSDRITYPAGLSSPTEFILIFEAVTWV